MADMKKPMPAPAPMPTKGTQADHHVTDNNNHTKPIAPTPDPRPTAINDLQPILRLKNEDTGNLEIKQGKFANKIYDVSGDRMVFNKKETDRYFPSKPSK